MSLLFYLIKRKVIQKYIKEDMYYYKWIFNSVRIEFVFWTIRSFKVDQKTHVKGSYLNFSEIHVLFSMTSGLCE